MHDFVNVLIIGILCMVALYVFSILICDGMCSVY